MTTAADPSRNPGRPPALTREQAAEAAALHHSGRSLVARSTPTGPNAQQHHQPGLEPTVASPGGAAR